MGCECSKHGRVGEGEQNTYSILEAKPKGKEPLGTPRRRWNLNTQRVTSLSGDQIKKSEM